MYCLWDSLLHLVWQASSLPALPSLPPPIPALTLPLPPLPARVWV